MKQPPIAYLTDKTGRVYDTMRIYARKPQADVDAMNATCKVSTDGKYWWTLEKPAGAAESEARLNTAVKRLRAAGLEPYEDGMFWFLQNEAGADVDITTMSDSLKDEFEIVRRAEIGTVFDTTKEA